MNANRMLGITVLILGVALLASAHFSETPIEHISNALTGRYADSTMWYIVGGVVLVVTGGFLTFSGKRA